MRQHWHRSIVGLFGIMGKKTQRPTMETEHQRRSKRRRGDSGPRPGFREQLRKASHDGVIVVTAILGDEVVTVQVTTGSRAPSEAAWTRFCTGFPGLPALVFGSRSGGMSEDAATNPLPEHVSMSPTDFDADEERPVVGSMAFDATKCQFEVCVNVEAFEACIPIDNKDSGVDAHSCITSSPVPARSDGAVGAGAGATAAATSVPDADDVSQASPDRAVEAPSYPAWHAIEAPKHRATFSKALVRAVRAFDESRGSFMDPDSVCGPCPTAADFVVFSRGAPAAHPAYEQRRFRYVNFARTDTGQLHILTHRDVMRAAALVQVQTAMVSYCHRQEGNTARGRLTYADGRTKFPAITRNLDACVSFRRGLLRRPRFIFEFEHQHRCAEQLQRSVSAYFADPYVAAVLVMRVYPPGDNGRRACVAVLYTRCSTGGVPARAWDMGAQPLHHNTQRAFGVGAPAIAGHAAVGGVPDALWVRHPCAPVDRVFSALMDVDMNYEPSPGRPVCSIDAETLYDAPPDVVGASPPGIASAQSVDEAPAPPLVINLGDVLAEYLLSAADWACVRNAWNWCV